MKRLKKIFCISIFILLGSLSFACKVDSPTTNTPSNINVSFDILKTVVESTEDMSSWQGIRAQTLNSSKTKVNSFVSNKGTSRALGNNVDFVHEHGDIRVYCDDNVRYYYNADRSYLDESEFDYNEYEGTVLNGYLSDVYNFFANKDNSKNLLKSSMTSTSSRNVYTFEFEIAESHDTVEVIITVDNNNKLISIKIIKTPKNSSDKTETEITENLDNINTPDWFESDDYKTPLTYDQVKAIVGADDLLFGWTGAEWFLPVGYSSDTEDKVFVASGDEEHLYTYTETATTKEFVNGKTLFRYTNGEPQEITLTDDEAHTYTFGYKREEFKNFAYNYFFQNESVYEDYYVASKKYEKDITVISYKYFGELNDVVFESICSLIYDTSDNLIEIRCYAKQESTVHASFELNLYMKKMNDFTMPEWFEIEDFNRELTQDEIEELLPSSEDLTDRKWWSFYVRDEIGSEGPFDVVGRYNENYFFKTYKNDGTLNYNIIRTSPVAKSVITNGYEYIYSGDEVYNMKWIDDPASYYEGLVEEKLDMIETVLHAINDDNIQSSTLKEYSDNGVMITIDLSYENEHAVITFKYDKYQRLNYIDLNLKLEGHEDRHLTIEKLPNRPSMPTWFDKSDFDGVLNYAESSDLFEKCSVLDWSNYKHTFSVEFEGHDVYADGVHVLENTHVTKFVEDNVTFSNYVVEREVSEKYEDHYKDIPHSLNKSAKILAIDKIEYTYFRDECSVDFLDEDNPGYLYNTENIINRLFQGEIVSEFDFQRYIIFEELLNRSYIVPFQCCIRTPIDNGVKYSFRYFLDESEAYIYYSIYLDFEGNCFKVEAEGNLLVYNSDCICRMTFEKTTDTITIPDWFNKDDFMVEIDLEYCDGDGMCVSTLFDASPSTIVSTMILDDSLLPQPISSVRDYFLGWRNKDTQELVASGYEIAKDERLCLEPVFAGDCGIISIASGSMTPTLKVGESYIYVAQEDYEVGDILVLNLSGLQLAHRLIRIETNGDAKIYITKGDASDTEDGGIAIDKIGGKIVSQIIDDVEYVPNFATDAILSFLEVRDIFSDEHIFEDIHGISYSSYQSENGTQKSYGFSLVEDNGKKSYRYQDNDGLYVWCDGTQEYRYTRTPSDELLHYNYTPIAKIMNEECFVFNNTVSFADVLENIKANLLFDFFTRQNVSTCCFEAKRTVKDSLTFINIKIYANGNILITYQLRYSNGKLTDISCNIETEDIIATLRMSVITTVSPETLPPDGFVFDSEDFEGLEVLYELNIDGTGFAGNHEVGCWLDIPSAEILCNGETAQVNSIECEIIAESGLTYEMTDDSFRPMSVGVYSIRYTATLNDGNVFVKVFEINVVDTTPPKIVVDTSIVILEEYVLSAEGGPLKIYIPSATAHDANTNILLDVSVELVSNNESKQYASIDDNGIYVIVSRPGSYELRYISEDPNGNKIRKTYSFSVVRPDN